jgi:NADPH:quinone reductase-like Zn-dependent oxidoreductase
VKAIVCDRYGSPSVLVLRDVEKPAPAEDEVLIRVRASSINSRDDRRMRANPFFIRFMAGGLFRPKTRILGADAAGTIEAIGARVKSFKVGDEVFGCLKRHQGQCFAEYALAGEEEIVLKPERLSFEQAAAVPLAALTALQALRDKGKLRPGEKVLIQGASGGVGGFAVQIAKALGGEVTAACSERNLEAALSLGASRAIDYRKTDFSQEGKTYGLILAVNGYRHIDDYLRALEPDGRLVVAGGSIRLLIQAASRKKAMKGSGGKRIETLSLEQSREDLLFMKGLLEEGKLHILIDATFPLEWAADAFRLYERDHARGKIVITMKNEGSPREPQ